MSSSPSPSPISRFGIFFLVGSLVLVFAIWGVLRYLADARKPTPRQEDGSHATAPVATSTGSTLGKDEAKTQKAEAVGKLSETISQALAVLRDPNNPHKRAALDALKQTLRAADPSVAVAAIRQFLDGKQDAATGLKFKVGDEHELDEAPTLRTFMMDQLGDISLGAGLGDAAEVARATLQSKDSPDEWAVAMRNLALADPDGSRSLLASKSRELIDYAPWQQAPTGGYLEAFDVAVYAGDPGVIADLAPLASSPSGALKQASQVTLQRLSTLARDKVANYLNANPNALAEVPLLRADYMGNMDLSTSNQITQAETYLSRADVTDAEKTKFLGRLALPAAFVADTLVTPSNVSGTPVFVQRAQVNKTASVWLASGNYPSLQTPLQNVVNSTRDDPSLSEE